MTFKIHKKFAIGKGCKVILTNIIFVLIGLFFLLTTTLFLTPINMNIVNEGTIVGVGGCLFFAAFFMSFPFALKFYQAFWATKIGKIAIIIFIIVVVSCVIIAIILSVLMISTANKVPDQPKTVVVLGCKVNGETPSRMLADRLDAAYNYLVENEDVMCIVTGGQGDNEVVPEAKVMKEYLVNKGIDAQRIFTEDESRNTRENLLNASKILEDNNLGKEIMIVTDGYHQYRSSLIAKKIGLQPYAISANTQEELVPVYWVREWVGIIHHTIFE